MPGWYCLGKTVGSFAGQRISVMFALCGSKVRCHIMHDDYYLCGWRVRSDLPLPELMPWTGDLQAPIDLQIELGAVEAQLPDLQYDGPVLQMGANGTCRFTIESVATYRIAPDGRTIRVQPSLPADIPAVRTFLFGTVFAIVCQRRTVIPLHACCVKLPSPQGDIAVAFTAPSGTGKSTLASAFMRRGYPILADDVTVLSLDQERGAVALPTFPRVKLWQDAMGQFGHAMVGAERVRQGMDKFSVGLGTEHFAVGAPLRLAALYHLERVEDAKHAGLEEVGGLPASVRFSKALYQERILMTVASAKGAHFSLVTRLAAGVARHVLVRQLSGFEHLDELVQRIVAFHAGTAHPA